MRRLQFACCLLLSLAPALGMVRGLGTGMPITHDGSSLIVITGASYAQAWGTPPLPGFTRVLNRGVGGDRTGDILRRFPADVVALSPDAVLIWGHVNNITQSKAEDRLTRMQAVRDDYETMLRLARAARIKVIFATEVPWTEEQGVVASVRAAIGRLRGKTSYASRISADVHELNEFLRQLAAREGCRLLDFESVFALDDGTRRPEYAAEDGSHITRAGYDALTAYAVRELRAAN